MEKGVAGEGAVIDMQALKESFDDDEEVLTQFLRNYLKVTGRQFTDLAEAVRLNDFSQVASLAHTLKSSARWIGADHLGDLFAALEQCGDSDAEEIQRKLEGIRVIYERVRLEIEQNL